MSHTRGLRAVEEQCRPKLSEYCSCARVCSLTHSWTRDIFRSDASRSKSAFQSDMGVSMKRDPETGPNKL